MPWANRAPVHVECSASLRRCQMPLARLYVRGEAISTSRPTGLVEAAPDHRCRGDTLSRSLPVPLASDVPIPGTEWLPTSHALQTSLSLTSIRMTWWPSQSRSAWPRRIEHDVLVPMDDVMLVQVRDGN